MHVALISCMIDIAVDICSLDLLGENSDDRYVCIK